MRFAVLTSVLLLAAGPALAQAPAVYHGALKGPTGADLGSITVTAAPKGVILRIEAKGLTPGWHGMHFHEKGSCTDDKFASAGGHVHSMTPVVHGLLNADANDAGDLPNLYVAADGTATTEVYSTLVTVKGDASHAALLDADGAAVVIHGNPDDYATQPIGGAGVRIACAVIQ
jgi:Cu-Zn family superoxide dismutase